MARCGRSTPSGVWTCRTSVVMAGGGSAGVGVSPGSRLVNGLICGSNKATAFFKPVVLFTSALGQNKGRLNRSRLLSCA